MNRMKSILLAGMAVLCLQVLRAGPVMADTTARKHADGSATTASNDAPANSDNDFLSDRMAWDGAVPAWSHEAMMNDSDPDYCIPRWTAVIAQASAPTSASTSSASAATGQDKATSDKKYLPVVVSENHFLNIWGHKKRDEAQKDLDGESKDDPLCEGVSSPKKLVEGRKIYVDPSEALRWGWEYGALVVPFKMQLGGKHAFTGSASVGAYLGYSLPMWDTGIVLSPVAFGGATSISVHDNSGKKDSTQSFTGLSYGLGVIGRVKDGFQVGVIFGKDHVDSSNYPYNDKTWISFEIGYSFAQ